VIQIENQHREQEYAALQRGVTYEDKDGDLFLAVRVTEEVGGVYFSGPTGPYVVTPEHLKPLGPFTRFAGTITIS